MEQNLTRRTVLKSIGAGAITLNFAGRVTANGDTRFLVLTEEKGVGNRVENTGFTVQHALADGDVLLVIGPSSERSDLENAKGVHEVAEDFKFELETPEFIENTADSRDEEFFPLQWDKQDITTDAVIAHDTATGDGTTVAIIDTGTEFGHSDLETNSIVDAGRLFRRGDIRQGDGRVELPKDFNNLSAGTKTVTRHVANDVVGHGTHVAGIAAASNAGSGDGSGVIGTAPDADVIALRVFWWTEDDDGNAVPFATFGDILTAVDHAANTGVDAMNMSIGTPPLPPQLNAGGIRGALERVIDTATARGSVVIVSAGNSSANLQQGGYFTLPNSIAGAMSISATGPNDKLVFYSNYGTNEIDVGAPGGGYETREKTVNPDADVEWPYPTNLVFNAVDPDTLFGQELDGAQYGYLAGTSMAAPQVTGTAALVREVAPHSTAEQVEKAIEQGAESVSGESNAELGAGRLNCDRALNADVIN